VVQRAVTLALYVLLLRLLPRDTEGSADSVFGNIKRAFCKCFCDAQYFVKINRGVYEENDIHYRISEVFFFITPRDF
jgi:hypothetical protein